MYHSLLSKFYDAGLKFEFNAEDSQPFSVSVEPDITVQLVLLSTGDIKFNCASKTQSLDRVDVVYGSIQMMGGLNKNEVMFTSHVNIGSPALTLDSVHEKDEYLYADIYAIRTALGSMIALTIKDILIEHKKDLEYLRAMYIAHLDEELKEEEENKKIEDAKKLQDFQSKHTMIGSMAADLLANETQIWKQSQNDTHTFNVIRFADFSPVQVAITLKKGSALLNGVRTSKANIVEKLKEMYILK
ncbi:TPA: hypothetical protein RI785_002373 [Vibrio cholerae]|nr:hypothetical protein [Vibrio cholerae]